MPSYTLLRPHGMARAVGIKVILKQRSLVNQSAYIRSVRTLVARRQSFAACTRTTVPNAQMQTWKDFEIAIVAGILTPAASNS